MKIQCPECGKSLELPQLRAGKFRPTCRGCEKPFLLAISSDTPPKIAIAKVKDAASPVPGNPASIAAAKPAQPSTAAKPIASSQADSVNRIPSVNADASSTQVVSRKEQTRAGSFDETAVTEVAQPDETAPSLATSAVRSRQPASSPSSSIANPSRASASSANPSTPNREDDSMPQRLGGYRLIRTLGRGAMGAVYEAKQLSLDRVVALKTIRDRLANNPSALARFTREAYAAAQLNHHNIVQIYDFGEDDGQHYFSMERVAGTSLNDWVREKGPLETRVAATYTLQAARGLQHAHRFGMVHRDVKPANLLLSEDGIVKVADLGLVKVSGQQDVDSSEPGAASQSRSSGSQVTMMGSALGTPAYMAPEQATDSTQVDHRADIYSLGCTLYFLLTGKPPYAAPDISTLISKHAQASVPRVTEVLQSVPPEVDKIISRSMAKSLNDRYSSLAEMIRDLEGVVGIKGDGPFTPSMQDAEAWSTMAKSFTSASPLAGMRGLLITGWMLATLLLFLVTPWLGLSWILLAPAFLVSAFLVGITLERSIGDSPVLMSLRTWLSSLGWVDWVYGCLALGLTLLIVVFAGCWAGVIVGALLGSAVAAAYHFLVRQPVRASRQSALESLEKKIRDFRVQGADEEGLRSFVARYSGKSWGDLFESLFGFESLLEMHDRSATDRAIPKVSLSLRERLASSLLARARSNREAIDQQKLSQVEQRALISEGVSAAEAQERAWQIAAAVMDASKLAPVEDATAAEAKAKRERVKAMLADARSGRYKKQRDVFAPFRLFFGAQLRLLAGIALLALAAMVVHRSGWLDTESLKAVTENLSQGDFDISSVGNQLASEAKRVVKSDAGAPTFLGVHVGAIATAGLLLFATAFISGWRMTPFAFIAACVILAATQLGIPAVGPIPAFAIAAAIGIAIIVPGAIWSEKRVATGD